MIEYQMNSIRICPFGEKLQTLLDERRIMVMFRPAVSVDGINRRDMHASGGGVIGVIRRSSNCVENNRENGRADVTGILLFVDMNGKIDDLIRTLQFLRTKQSLRKRCLERRRRIRKKLREKYELNETDYQTNGDEKNKPLRN